MTTKRAKRASVAPGGPQLVELIGNAELQGVAFLELHASRKDIEGASEWEPDDGPNMRVWYRAEDSQIQVRCRLDLRTEEARFVADAVADFSVSGDLPSQESVQAGFTQRIGVAVIYPYLRESVHNLAQKIGVDPPILSLIARALNDFESPVSASKADSV
ncbi:hypothetical protein GTY40_24365 [Streptomyces sp. SID8359]|uniref:hypothetical protein n=1 Tax=unclassified Streptomyces TaxID=2593676 RepID=UPI0012FE8A4A|nr:MULTISPECIES: hypothetical protein [unclassified Streptomyces]MYT94155.1 hypothetical protein [Streptomyces sp. SID8359]